MATNQSQDGSRERRPPSSFVKRVPAAVFVRHGADGENRKRRGVADGPEAHAQVFYMLPSAFRWGISALLNRRMQVTASNSMLKHLHLSAHEAGRRKSSSEGGGRVAHPSGILDYCAAGRRAAAAAASSAAQRCGQPNPRTKPQPSPSHGASRSPSRRPSPGPGP